MAEDNKPEDTNVFSRVLSSFSKTEDAVEEKIETPEDTEEKPVTKSTTKSTKSTRKSTTKRSTKSSTKSTTKSTRSSSVKVTDITPARNTSTFPIEVSKTTYKKLVVNGWKDGTVSKDDVSAVESVLFYQKKGKVVRINYKGGPVGKVAK